MWKLVTARILNVVLESVAKVFGDADGRIDISGDLQNGFYYHIQNLDGDHWSVSIDRYCRFDENAQCFDGYECFGLTLLLPADSILHKQWEEPRLNPGTPECTRHQFCYCWGVRGLFQLYALVSD